MPDHPMPYRILWTWDAWVCDPFSAASYVDEYRRLIDFAAEWDYNGIIIWGFIDERHGGEESAREVARYGKERGVRILPGVGAGGYGGFVTSEGHRWNITTLLHERPHLAAVMRDAPDKPTDWWVCLYQQETLDWLRDGAAWLAEGFEIGGVNIETNESAAIDVCEFAREATEQEPNRLRYANSFTDLSIAVPIIYDEIRRTHPDAWVTYATYEPAWWRRQEDFWLLRDMPEDAVAQWNTELDVADDPVTPPVKRNISLIHSGGWSYHLDAIPPIWSFTQYRCFCPLIAEARRFARNQHTIGTQGFDLGNVGSSVMPDNEINYIACNEFARTPDMTVDEFSGRFIARLYGEKAEPLVKQLMLDQTEIHRGMIGVWYPWTRLMMKGSREKLPAAGESDVDAFRRQIDLARRAYDAASEMGRSRLGTIIQVLDEYRIIAEVSRDSKLAWLVSENETMDDAGRKEELEKLARMLSDAGLADATYHYSRLTR